ncbi:PLC-like phosphodiesterase, partial [Verticillium dahliae]
GHGRPDQRFRVPSLEELRGQDLIKCKKPPKKIEVPLGPARLTKSRTQEDGHIGVDEENASNSTTTTLRGAAPKALRPRPAPTKAAKVPVCAALGDLAIYTHSEHFKGFETRRLHAQQELLYARLPQRARFDSSNPDSSLFWRKGVQMVALNWQYLDEGMMLNEGMFAGEQGWVLKPPGYRDADKTCFAQADARTPARGSGGTSYDGKYKLETAPMKTSHPDWGDKGELLKFPLVPRVVEELSFVR